MSNVIDFEVLSPVFERKLQIAERLMRKKDGCARFKPTLL